MGSTPKPAIDSSQSPDAFTGAGGMPAVPLVLGVVGHRDVQEGEREALRSRLINLFREFRAAYLHTPLLVVSSLAEGADQIAADAALEAGAFVRAPLPFPPDAYRASTSFDHEVARTHLDTLLADPRVESYVVPLPPRRDDEPKPDWLRVATNRDEESDRSRRHACYANAGGHIVRRCHVLVALWDGPGGSAGGPSGTAEFVAFKLRGTPPPDFPWADAEPLGFRGERGLVIVVHTPRTAPREATTARIRRGKSGTCGSSCPMSGMRSSPRPPRCSPWPAGFTPGAGSACTSMSERAGTATRTIRPGRRITRSSSTKCSSSATSAPPSTPSTATSSSPPSWPMSWAGA